MDHCPRLTPEQEEMVEETLTEMLVFEQDHITASTGYRAAAERPLERCGAERVIAECRRLYRSFFVNCVLSSRCHDATKAT